MFEASTNPLVYPSMVLNNCHTLKLKMSFISDRCTNFYLFTIYKISNVKFYKNKYLKLIFFR